jgi:hypothetical protein
MRNSKLKTAENPPACTSLAPELPPEVIRIVDAWPDLPLHIRTSILALVNAARAGQAGR